MRYSNSQSLPTDNLKIAVFYDWINQWGGAERVLLNILKIYPQADIFTLVHDPQKTSWLPSHPIHTSFINRLPFSSKNPIYYTPLYDIALEQFNFSAYDIVISTTSTIGHCLLTPPRTLFVTYFHNINRHLYSKKILKFYQRIDYIYSRRPDAILCNSQTVSKRIEQTYQLTPQIISPGIDTDFFHPTPYPSLKYFLIVGRLVAHKRFDIVIKAFNQNKLPLLIIGTGRDQSRLHRLAQSPHIKFVAKATDQELLSYYQNCLALVCPQLEDFGLAALEAQACGRPVIAYGQGGNTETIINGQTGLFFSEQSTYSLQNTLNIFLKTSFNSKIIRQHSLRFSDKNFMLNFKQTIDELWQHHQTTMF